MKRTSLIALAMLLCLLLTCCAPKAVLTDQPKEDTLTKELAFSIVRAFNGNPKHEEITFSADQPLPYAQAFSYFSYGGFYTLDAQLREELTPYKQDGKYHIPAALVEDFLLSKFNTKVDRSAVSCYDKGSNCYVTTPAATYEGAIVIDSLTQREDGSFVITALERTDVNNAYLMTEQIFTLKYAGDFRFLSVEQKDKPFQELNDEEQRLVEVMERFDTAHLGIEFDEAAPVPYESVFPYFANVGIFDETGSVREELSPYATGEYPAPYIIPAHIVDDYLLTKFNTSADPSVIGSYNTEDDTYTITPNPGDSQIFYELIDWKKEGNIYTATVKQRHWQIPDHVYTCHFVIEMTEEDHKFLTFYTEK